jgi:hypothetical protein
MLKPLPPIANRPRGLRGSSALDVLSPREMRPEKLARKRRRAAAAIRAAATTRKP